MREHSGQWTEGGLWREAGLSPRELAHRRQKTPAWGRFSKVQREAHHGLSARSQGVSLLQRRPERLCVFKESEPARGPSSQPVQGKPSRAEPPVYRVCERLRLSQVRRQTPLKPVEICFPIPFATSGSADSTTALSVKVSGRATGEGGNAARGRKRDRASSGHLVHVAPTRKQDRRSRARMQSVKGAGSPPPLPCAP